MGKAKWKQLQLPQSRKILNKKALLHSWRDCRISAIIKDRKEVGVMLSITSPFNCLFGLCRIQMDLGG